MWFQNLFKPRNSTSSRRQPNRRPASRLCLEAMEDRCLLTFSPALTYPVGVGPQAVVSGDFNNDAHPDLAVANYYSTVAIQQQAILNQRSGRHRQ